MTPARAAVLAALLDETFEEFADMYAEALDNDNDGALEQVITQLQEIGKAAFK